MRSRIANVALIGVAVASMGAALTTRGAVGRQNQASSSTMSTQDTASSASSAMLRWRAILALPKHRSARVERRSVAPANANAIAYRVIDLQKSFPPGSTIFYPSAINNSGRIVGTLGSDAYAIGSPYIINNDGTGAYLHNPNAYGTGTYVSSISNSGQTAGGWYSLATPSDPYNINYAGVIWTLTGATGSSEVTTPNEIRSIAQQNVGVGGDDYDTASGKTTTLVKNSCGRKLSDARAINDSGLIGGNSEGYVSDATYAVVMKIGGCPTAVPNLAPGYSSVSAINKNGDLLIDRYRHGPVFWKQGRVYPIPLPRDYTLGDSTSILPFGINASDAIVGELAGSYPGEAFLYADGRTVYLASLFPANSGWQPVYATGINDSGEIIGVGYKDNNLKGFALLH